VSPSTPIADLPIGVSEVAPIINATDATYIEFLRITNEVLGYSIPSTNLPFRFYLKNTKRTAVAVRQELTVVSNFTNSIGDEFFRLTRETSTTTGEWYPWRVDVSIIYGVVNPNNNVSATRGCLYFDYTTAMLYRKTTATAGGSSTGWVSISEPKGFLSVGHNSNITITTAPFVIRPTFTYATNSIIPYDSSTGEFTLTQGRTYKIQFTANIVTTGKVDIRMLNSSGGNVNSNFGTWHSGGGQSSNMYSAIISVTTTGKFRLAVTGHSVASSTISQYTSNLEIVEI